MFVSIYSLIDPRTGEVRYIGKTQQKPMDRLYRHIARARSGSGSDIAFWLRSLELEGKVRPQEVCDKISATRRTMFSQPASAAQV